MNDIKLSNYPSRGVKTEINGVELLETVTIDLHCPVDGLPTLTVEQLAHKGLNVELNGLVQPVIVALPGFEIFVEHVTPTRTKYWTAPEKAK